LILSKAACFFAPQVNLASFFSRSMGVKEINLSDKFAINYHKKFTLPMNFWTSLLQVGAWIFWMTSIFLGSISISFLCMIKPKNLLADTQMRIWEDSFLTQSGTSSQKQDVNQLNEILAQLT
jgi:hypothetical protein